MESKRLAIEDLATIGIFSAVMIVIFITLSMITGTSLSLNMVFNTVFTTLTLGPFFVYMAMKADKPGVTLIYNIVQAVLATASAGSLITPRFVDGRIIVELSVLGMGSYRDVERITIAWAITSLIRTAHGVSEIWFFEDAFIRSGVSPEQVQIQIQYYTDPKWILVSLACIVMAAIISYYLGNKMAEEHFKKTDIIK